MLIVCPSCASEYNVDAGHLGSEGRRVRCFSCNTDWFAQPTADADAPGINPLKGRTAKEFINDEWQRAEADGSSSDYAPSQETGAEDSAGQQDELSGQDARSQAIETHEPLGADDVHVAAGDSSLPAVGVAALPGQMPAQARRKKTGAAAHARQAHVARSGPRPVAGAVAIFGVLVMMACIWQRDVLVRHAPALATPFEKMGLSVNVRGLEFDKSASELVNDQSGRFLVVQGLVRNVTSRQVPVPQIEIVVRDAMSKPVYTWAVEPPKNVLAAGETLSFRTRLAAPPQDGHDVMLRFQRNSGQMKVAQK